VVRDPGGLEAPGERGELAEVALVQRIGRADRQGHAVQHERRGGARALEHRERPPPRIMKFSEIASNQSRAPCRRARGEVRGAKADP